MSAEICPQCFGTGTDLTTGSARLCACRSSDSRAKFLASAQLPKRYAHCTLDNFKPVSVSQQRALLYSRTLVTEYPDITRGLLLTGSVGVGKTHLAVAMLRGLVAKGVPCLFYESGALLKRIQSSYSPVSQMSEASVLAPVYEAEVLLLDELGASMPTNWVRETLYQIINTRYNDKKLTLFTSNYGDTQKPDLEERIGVPLRSRLYEMVRRVAMDGPDHRKQEYRVDA